MSVWFTDEELGFVQDHMDWTAREIAQHLGRSLGSGEKILAAMRQGRYTRRMEPWSAEDDATLLDLRNLSARECAAALGRSVQAIRGRRKALGIADKSALLSPFCPGHRTIVCRTCDTCGELLDGSFFGRVRGGGRPSAMCVRCKTAKYPPRAARTTRQVQQSQASRDRLQALTLPLAVNHGNPWTLRDHEVLADPDLRPVEKAIRLGRTYKATRSALSAGGYSSKVGLGPKEEARWLIEAPRAYLLAMAVAA
jgi:hypothetical protein